MKKYFLIILSIFYVFTNVNAQKKSFYPVGTQNKNKNKQKEENSKDDYQYKSFYFTAIKQGLTLSEFSTTGVVEIRFPLYSKTLSFV